MPDDNQKTPKKGGYFSSAVSTFFDTVHRQFCASLEIRRLAKERERNRHIAALINSEAEISKAKTTLQTATSYDGPAEIVKAKVSVEIAQLESDKKLYRAKKGVEDAKQEFAHASNTELHDLKRQQLLLQAEESLARLRSSIRTHTREENTGTETASSKPKPSPDEYRDRKMTRLKVVIEDDAVLDEWRRDQLAQLDELKQNELAQLDANSWSEEQKMKKRYEIEARYSNRREQVLTAKL